MRSKTGGAGHPPPLHNKTKSLRIAFQLRYWRLLSHAANTFFYLFRSTSHFFSIYFVHKNLITPDRGSCGGSGTASVGKAPLAGLPDSLVSKSIFEFSRHLFLGEGRLPDARCSAASAAVFYLSGQPSPFFFFPGNPRRET